jgi:predicted protein tyrosine phosphatase
MIEVYDRLFVGGETDCRPGNEELVVVHACKSPCHQRAVGYHGSLPSSHPNYLVLEHSHDLYLNIIDPDQPLFMPPLFTSFLKFAGRHWDDGKKVLIHCNQGESRSPTLAMMLMAKHIGAITDASYDEARAEFERLYAGYRPGLGIQTYLRRHWTQF